MTYDVALQQHGREKHCIGYSGINVFADTSKTTEMSSLNELIVGYPVILVPAVVNENEKNKIMIKEIEPTVNREQGYECLKCK